VDSWKYDSGGFTWPYGGSNSVSDTLYTSGSYSHAFPRKATAYNVTVWAYLEAVYGSVQPCETVTIPALTTPSAPSNCSHIRNDDSSNTVSWTNNGSNPRSNNLIERSVDGGGYSQIASVAAAASSYVDATTQPDHSYSYRVRAIFSANGYNMYSGYSNASAITYNSPAVPTELAASRSSEDTVSVAFRNVSLVATGVEYQRSGDNTASWSSAVAISGVGIESFTDEPGGGTWYYRARTTRDSLTSGWSQPSNAVVTIIAPAAPKLNSPLSGSVVNKALSPTRLEWTHNPIDGSAQTEAEIRLSTDNGLNWGQTIQINGSAAYYDHATSWSVNAQVLWQVRTKGAHPEFGDWSSVSSFSVFQVPQVAITSPQSDESIIETMPIPVTWTYSDQCGSQLSATLRLFDTGGRELWRKAISGGQKSYDIYPADILPDNNAQFMIRLEVSSTSTLTAQTTRAFTTDYREPAVPDGTATIDESKASVSLVVTEGVEEGLPATSSLSIIRRHADGRQVMLVNEVPSGTSIDDPFCPIEQNITYVFVAHTETGAISRLEVPVRISGEMCYWINYGAKVCAVILDSSAERSSDHDVAFYNTAGSEFPLAFYGDAKDMSGSFSGTSIRSKSDLTITRSLPVETSDFDDLAAHIGAVVIRMPYVDAFVADVLVSQSASERALEKVSLTWKRVRNHGLAI
jgi:hypothetical protein